MESIDHAPAPCAVATPLLPRRASSRETILDAAEATVLADGAAHLTLDAVAERAGVSKGGLLYNFPSKELLLQAMVDRQLRRLEQKRLLAVESLPATPGRELRACVMMAADASLDGDRRLGCATLAATANNPQMLEPVRAAHARRLELIAQGAQSSGLPFERSAIIALAVDGLFLLETLQISPYKPGQRKRILGDLLRLIDETADQAVGQPHPPEVQSVNRP